jgi:hypothetical protein
MLLVAPNPNNVGGCVSCCIPLPPADRGVDRVLSAQGALTRDTTYLVNGAQVGARDIVTVSPRGGSRGGWCAVVYIWMCMFEALQTRVEAGGGCTGFRPALCLHAARRRG